MKSNLDFARGLALKAEDDLLTAEMGIEHGAPLETVCFHLRGGKAPEGGFGDPERRLPFYPRPRRFTEAGGAGVSGAGGV